MYHVVVNYAFFLTKKISFLFAAHREISYLCTLKGETFRIDDPRDVFWKEETGKHCEIVVAVFGMTPIEVPENP